MPGSGAHYVSEKEKPHASNAAASSRAVCAVIAAAHGLDASLGRFGGQVLHRVGCRQYGTQIPHTHLRQRHAGKPG